LLLEARKVSLNRQTDSVAHKKPLLVWPGAVYLEAGRRTPIRLSLKRAYGV
jgi:hypothetical protein